jgi:hypothetical protein
MPVGDRLDDPLPNKTIGITIIRIQAAAEAHKLLIKSILLPWHDLRNCMSGGVEDEHGNLNLFESMN